MRGSRQPAPARHGALARGARFGAVRGADGRNPVKSMHEVHETSVWTARSRLDVHVVHVAAGSRPLEGGTVHAMHAQAEKLQDLHGGER